MNLRFCSKTQWQIDVSVGVRPPRWCPSGWTPTWRLHTNLYKFGWNTFANSARIKISRDLILGEVGFIAIIYHIPDSWIYVLNGYDFLFWSHDWWKPRINWTFISISSTPLCSSIFQNVMMSHVWLNSRIWVRDQAAIVTAALFF